jgi:hypothetical protein
MLRGKMGCFAHILMAGFTIHNEKSRSNERLSITWDFLNQGRNELMKSNAYVSIRFEYVTPAQFPLVT